MDIARTSGGGVDWLSFWFFRAALHFQKTPVYDLLLSKALMLSAGGVILSAAIVRGRIIGNGNVGAGLGNEPVSRRPIIIVLAIVTCAYAALAGYTWYKTFPNVVANNASHPWLCLIGIFVAVFLSPVAEELFFRGWLWIGLRRTWSAFPTALVTALFWLAVHLDQGFGIFIFLIPVAAILTIARQVAKSSRAPIALHAIYNLVASGLPLTLGLLASVPEPAKASLPAVSLSRNALSGNEVQISAMNFVNVDCSSGPVPNVRVVTPPKNGSVRLDQTTITVDRPKDNARAHCNGKSVKAMGVYYKSSSGFNGNDEVVFDTDFLEGTVWRYVVTINVR